MRKTYILPFLRSAAVIIAVSLSSSCHHAGNNETADILKNVESYMNERPDSALTVIQSIGAEDLSSRELKARHALLLSQLGLTENDTNLSLYLKKNAEKHVIFLSFYLDFTPPHYICRKY